MPTKYDQSLIVTGGKLISNQETNPNNSISFQRKIKENIDPDLNEDYIEVNCKIIIDKINYVNFIGVLKDYIPTGGKAEEAVDKIDNTSNLIILDTTLANDIYTLKLGKCTFMPQFDKGTDGQIVFTLNSSNIKKTDHGEKTDHSEIPWIKEQ